MIHRTETWLRAAAFPGAWVASLLFHHRLLGLPTLCLWKRFTGLECYGCGMGRALVAAFNGDFAGAWHQHRLVFVAIACLAFVCAESVQELRAMEG
jgi:Protein of unknown function (DUF2752)